VRGRGELVGSLPTRLQVDDDQVGIGVLVLQRLELAVAEDAQTVVVPGHAEGVLDLTRERELDQRAECAAIAPSKAPSAARPAVDPKARAGNVRSSFLLFMGFSSTEVRNARRV
jgi:hypothetical protein